MSHRQYYNSIKARVRPPILLSTYRPSVGASVFTGVFRAFYWQLHIVKQHRDLPLREFWYRLQTLR